MTLNNQMVRFQQCWSFGECGVPLIDLLPSPPVSLGPRMVVSERLLSMGQIELNCVLMLNCIVWNRSVLTFKLRSYANWIVWNWTVFVYQNELFEIERLWHLTVCKQKHIFILNWNFWNRSVFCIKMDLSLNNLQKLIYHKPNPTKNIRKRSRYFFSEFLLPNTGWCKFSILYI